MAGIGKKRVKKRTHLKEDPTSEASVPKSMVIRVGASEIGKSLSLLTRDLRHMMEPHTAVRLRERKANKLKDYITMTGPLGVSHLMVLSRSDTNANLRIVRAPRGPALHFRIHEYMLNKDVRNLQKTPKSPNAEFLTPPLLVMNHFNTKSSKETPHEALLTTTFQNMFPPLSLQSTNINSVKRVLLLNKRDDGYIDLRHYLITTKPVGVSRPINRLLKGQTHPSDLPDLNGVRDISDFVLHGEGMSGVPSDSEAEEDATVEVSRPTPTKIEEKLLSESQLLKPKQQAIKLIEIGPRLTLELTKVTEEAMGGKVLYHSHVQKSEDEVRQLDKYHNENRSLKEKRKRAQEQNVQRKLDKKNKKSKKNQPSSEHSGSEASEGEEEEEAADGHTADV
ncbi:RNA-binding protein involved in ribosomal large subunit assembly and maintenance [Schizosaccharomyces osmophilus]|uniref:RNA-binding protein involved in ribosomal large subunit assembly and maintenance n=1 Tax=Schizosaccharomyces osmophilus TaxID=2545709 RepID=A0AAE9WC72_9SCHI|nr:RNA-binding protein involved in ribosomal large subunit assembly and maintenance [Schizosaccharomyces osmophilus]WBW73150.1 RNA-binding protein involved in ribosomal large subunit assembly and maintenance [Schizosaccharomyces osmophilus]